MDAFGLEGMDFPTETTVAQWEVELTARDIYDRAVRAGTLPGDPSGLGPDDGSADFSARVVAAGADGWEDVIAVLKRDEHVAYLRKSLGRLSAGHVVLDASRCWLCYWIVHALALLDAPPDPGTARDVVSFLALCQHPDGGFGGGPGQMPHLAPTYAAVACLAEIATPDAFACVHRASMRAFLLRCRDDRVGGYRMHDGGETDARGCYAAMAVAHLLGLADAEVTRGVPAFVARCQTHEGGLGGEPGAEAHGGYTFCGLAALTLLGRADALDLPELAHWLVMRQGAVEGGFMGRTNKLVDGCYSFWQGGAFPLLGAASAALLQSERERTGTGGNAGEEEEEEEEEEETARGEHFRDGPRSPPRSPRKQRGVPACALFPSRGRSAESDSDAAARSAADASFGFGFSARALQGWILLCCQLPSGGLQDKPGKGRDHYHTCYCLSGLSVAQHWGGEGVVGPRENALARTHPAVNVTEEAYRRWMRLATNEGEGGGEDA